MRKNLFSILLPLCIVLSVNSAFAQCTAPTISFGSATNPSICGGNDGYLTISGLDPDSSYTLSYTDNGNPFSRAITADGSGNDTISGLSAADIISDIYFQTDLGCYTDTLAGPYNVTNPSAPSISSVYTTNPYVCGGRGYIFIYSLSPYTYFSFNIEVNGVPHTGTGYTDFTGTYTVGAFGFTAADTVTDIYLQTFGGCNTDTLTGPFTFSDPVAPTASFAGSANPSICGNNDGYMVISGLPSYVYYTIYYTDNGSAVSFTVSPDGSGNVFIDGLSASDTIADIYFLTDRLCYTNTLAGPYYLTNPPAPIIGFVSSANPSICGNDDGTITFGGLSPGSSYTIYYTDGFAGTASPVSGTTVVADGSGNITISGLSAFDNISNVYFQTLLGCTTNTLFGPYSVTNPPAPTISYVGSTSPSTCGGSDGSITISGLVPSTSYTIYFRYNGIPVSTSISADGSGNYAITGLSASDIIGDVYFQTSLGCNTDTLSGPYSVTNPPAPTISYAGSTSPSTCGGSDGSITISGLVPSTSYIIYFRYNGIPVSTSISADGSGNYAITGLSTSDIIGDIYFQTFSGCYTDTLAGPYSVTNPPASPISYAGSTNPSVCGGSDGYITISGLMPSTPYTIYLVYNGSPVSAPMFTDGSGNATIGGLSASSIVSDVYFQTLSGCYTDTLAGPYSVTNPPVPAISYLTSGSPSACGGSNGYIAITGLALYSFYTIHYTDNGSPISRAITSDGSGNDTIAGLSSSDNISNVYFQTALGCYTDTLAGPYSVTSPPAPTIVFDSVSNPSICGGSDGTLVISGLTADSNYIVYYTDNGTSGFSQSVTADGAGNGTITGFSVSDVLSNVYIQTLLGCTTNTLAGPYNFTNPPVPAINYVGSTSPTECGDNNGSLTIGGLNPFTGYTLSYTDNGTPVSVAITSDGSGNYLITGLSATDIITNVYFQTTLGCFTNVLSGPYNVTNPPVPTVVFDSVTNPSECGNNNGSITISGLIADSVYAFYYTDNGTPLFIASVIADGSGNYSFTGLSALDHITNIFFQTALGCYTDTLAGPYNPANPSAPFITYSDATSPDLCGDNDGYITVVGLVPDSSYILYYTENGTPKSLFVYADGFGRETIADLSATDIITNVYFQTMLGCYTDTVTGPYHVTNPPVPSISFVKKVIPSECGNNNGYLVIGGLTADSVYDVIYYDDGTPKLAHIAASASGTDTIRGFSVLDTITNIYGLTVLGCYTDTLTGPYSFTNPPVPAISFAGTTYPSECGNNNGHFYTMGLTIDSIYTIYYKDNGVPESRLTTVPPTGKDSIAGLSAYDTITDVYYQTALGCYTDTLSGPYSVGNPPVPPISFDSIKNPNGCDVPDGDFVLSGLSADSVYYVYFRDNGGLLLETLTADAGGHITITGLATSDTLTDVYIQTVLGCNSNILSGPYIFIYSFPPPTGIDTVCVGSTTSLSDIVAGGTWSSGSPSIGHINVSGVFTAVSAGTVKITYTLPSGCSESIWVTVLPLPIVAPILGDTVACVDSTLQLSDATVGGSWSSSDTSVATVSSTGVVTRVRTGAVTITYLVSTPCGIDSVYVVISLCSDSVSSGSGGGLESENLGTLVGLRDYNKYKNNSNVRIDYKKTPLFSKYNADARTTGSGDRLLNLVPASLNSSTKAYISTPADLTSLTTAVDALSVDYVQNNVAKAVVLAITTEGRAYNHTKSICDRFRGATLLGVDTVTIQGYRFLQYTELQPTGEVEFAIAFDAGKSYSSTSFNLQTKWLINQYKGDDSVFNFQAWATIPQNTQILVSKILDNLAAIMPLQQVDTAFQVPPAYIAHGQRDGGNLDITITNSTNISNASLVFEENTNELAATDSLVIPLTLVPGIDNKFSVNVKDGYQYQGYLNLGGKLVDVVYMADGNWSLDYDHTQTSVNYSIVNQPSRIYNDSDYNVYRGISLNTTSADYLSAYKFIASGDDPVDLTKYNSFKFWASSGVGPVTIKLLKSSIVNWADQYATTINLSSKETDYAISLDDFTSSTLSAPFKPNDVTAVVYQFVFNGQTTTMNFDANTLSFSTDVVASQKSLNSKLLTISPNPNDGTFQCKFNSSANQQLEVAISDVAGRTIYKQMVQATIGANTIQVILPSDIVRPSVLLVSLENTTTGAKYNSVKVLVTQ